MTQAVAEADYQDYYQEDTYDYRNDSLLTLVLGVHSYLSELENTTKVKTDSPLYHLQYKMYIFMRQRAVELGIEL
ncbi:hypothetical protein BDB01DRAFT_722615 [Pilobolus umbonatus]|nr:hypothetical protein BDB01DRAFT_722615 [Pilobolus umbonatus]